MDERPKRRWFRIRFSTLLFLLVIAACSMAFPPLETATVRVQQQATVSEFQILKLSEVGVLPIVALAVFATWKIASAVAERRFARSV